MKLICIQDLMILYYIQTTEDQYEPTGVTDDEDEEVEDDLAEVFDDDFKIKFVVNYNLNS